MEEAGRSMNESIAKKLGEVWAFSRIGLEIKRRAGEAFAKALGANLDFEEKLTSYALAVEKLELEAAAAKADKTESKLKGMMEAYIGDDWDDPVEILEWLSFFTGAAAAHWSLIKGAANQLGDSALMNIAEDAYRTYMSYLNLVNKQLEQRGREKATG